MRHPSNASLESIEQEGASEKNLEPIQGFEPADERTYSRYRAENGRHHIKSIWLVQTNHHAPAPNVGWKQYFLTK